jgi:hypothetical protein
MLTVLTQKLANRIRLRTEPPLGRILVMRGAKRETAPPAAPYRRFERNTLFADISSGTDREPNGSHRSHRHCVSRIRLLY